MKSINYRKFNVGVVALIILVMSIIIASQSEAADVVLKWKKLDTMDTNFNIVDNKAGDEDILLELDVSNAGTYSLFYYLEDGRQTEIKLEQTYDILNVEYHVQEMVSGVVTDITQTLTALSYLEIDYGSTVPVWTYDGGKLVGASGGLEYSIARSASSKYPGVAFEINNKKVLIKWDFQQDKAYVLINNYESGKIMPVSFTTSSAGTEAVKILKQLEDFTARPIHVKANDAGTDDEEVTPIVLPNDTGDKPGNRPGIDVTFKQPKELNATTWQYEYTTTDFTGIKAIFEFADIGSDAYMDFNIKLKNDGDSKIYALEMEDLDEDLIDDNENVEYRYDAATHAYTIRIVKDKSDLVNKLTTVQWSELEASRIYDVSVGFQVDIGLTTYDQYEFITYKPEDKFAYTYMNYELKRSNVEEAYLDIEPYSVGEREEVEYIVLYSKVIKSTLDIEDDLWLKNYHSSEDGNNDIFIPVPFRSTSSQDAYQVIIRFSNTDLYSQVLNYKAIEDEDIPPRTPTIEAVDNLFVIPPLDDASQDPNKVQMDIVFEAPTNKEIKELDMIFEDNNGLEDDYLYYELSINDVPTDTETNAFEVVKVFEVYKEGGEYKIKLHDNVSGEVVASEIVHYNFGYNETDELFRVEKIGLYEEGAWSHKLNTVIDDVADSYTVTDSGDEHNFAFPGVNYMRLRAIMIKDGEVSSSQLSVPVSLSLSMVKYEVPMVDTLTYKPLYGVESARTTGITAKWHSISIDNYENNMLSPVDKTVDKVIYSVYIAEEMGHVLPLDDDDTNHTKVDMTNDGLVEIDEAQIATLRNEEVIYFDLVTDKDTNANLSVDIEGLDVNRNYYIRIVTKIDIKDTPDVGAPATQRRSSPSSVLSVTVPKTPEEPGDEEVFPLAPELFTVEFSDTGLISTGLSWYLPTEMTFADDLHGFEVLGIEDRSIPEELISKEIAIVDVLTSSLISNNVVEGWRLYVHNGVTYFKKYDSETATWEDQDLSLVVIEGNKFYIIDDSNAPNKVNYYYVRTIKLTDELVKSASPWVQESITTAPVKGPINLKVDYETDYTYEPKEAFIIRFDAPISDISQIGTDYTLEIHIKGEDDTDYSLVKYPSTYVGTTVGAPVGYKRLYYRVSDLTSGKTYRIKIRIEDRTKPQEVLPDGTLSYPKSPYSEIVISRTEFDQEDYDKEVKYYEYISYYEKKSKELKELLYFIVTSTTDETAVKYRENYSEGMIKLSSNSELKLYTEDKSINTFYLPSNTLESINDSNVTLVIESKNQQVGLRPDTIGVNITDEIDEIINNIIRYKSTEEDYYIRIRVYTDSYQGEVNGKTPSSELVQVEIGIVGSSKLEEDIDTLMLKQLEGVIESNKYELIAKIEEELEKGIDDNMLYEIVEEMVEDVKKEYMANASVLFKSQINQKITMISKIDRPMYIALEPMKSSANNNVYTKQNGVWKKMNSTYFNNKYRVETTTFNPYILIPTEETSSDLVEVYSQDGVDVMNTYGLSDIFSAYDLDNKSEVMDKYQWIGALSRLIGATSGSDTADYLNDRGIKVSSLNSYSSLPYDYALDLFVETYAYKHNINLNSIQITNYNIIDDLSSADQQYRYNILVGANLGIIRPSGGLIDPKHKLNMEDTIKLLIILHNGLDG